MGTGTNPEEVPSSSPTNSPNGSYIHTSDISRSSNSTSSTESEKIQTPAIDACHYYPSPLNFDTYDHSSFPQTPELFLQQEPFPQPLLPPLRTTIQTLAPSQPLPPTPGTARPSIPSGPQYGSIPRGPNTNTFVSQRQQISRNYQGNHDSLRNQSADIPPEQSTSVWITNLPPDCDYRQLLATLRDVGKVYATVINPPDGRFMTSAAKIVFFDVEGRQRFKALANAGQFAVGAYVPRVRPNRILTEAQPVGPESRILRITGPTTIVNRETLFEYFRRWCAFDIEYIQHSNIGERNATMVWAFGSYRCQAERVFIAIRDIKAYSLYPSGQSIWDSVIVRYERDPCDRSSEYAVGNAG